MWLASYTNVSLNQKVARILTPFFPLVTPRQIWERYNPGKPLPTKEEIDNIFKDPQLEWAAMPDFSWGD